MPLVITLSLAYPSAEKNTLLVVSQERSSLRGVSRTFKVGHQTVLSKSRKGE